METLVEGRLLSNAETVADAGLAVETAVAVSVVYKPNTVRCSHQGAITRLRREIDTDLLLMVEFQSNETRIGSGAFQGCKM